MENRTTVQAKILRRMAYASFRETEFEANYKNIRRAFSLKSVKLISKFGICRESIDKMRLYYVKKVFKAAHKNSQRLICNRMEEAVETYSIKF